MFVRPRAPSSLFDSPLSIAALDSTASRQSDRFGFRALPLRQAVDEPWEVPTPVHQRPPAQMYDSSIMETATLGSWRQTVHQVFEMSQFPAESGGREGEAVSSSDDSDYEFPEMRRLSRPGAEHMHPVFYDWMVVRMGTRMKLLLVSSFSIFEGSKVALAEKAYAEGTNLFSIIVVTNLVSLMLALAFSFGFEGQSVASQLFSLEPTVRFLGISFLFTFASVLIVLAYNIGTPPVEAVTLGYIYLPLSTILSYYVFRRRYGSLEWLSVAMMSLAVLAFILLREQSKDEVAGSSFDMRGFGLVFGAVAISVSASILAERTFKEQALCGMRRGGQTSVSKFYVLKVHLDFASLVISAVLWVLPCFLPNGLDNFLEEWSRSKHLFGNWGFDQVKMVIIAVAQGWAAGLVTKEFSTVVKAVVQTIAVTFVMLFEDKFLGDRFDFDSRQVPSVMLAIILVLSAVIFQTGRLNLMTLRKAANIDAGPHPELQMVALAEPESGVHLNYGRFRSKPQCGKSRTASTRCGKSQVEVQTLADAVETSALICIYIISDTGRTLVLQKSLQSTVVNSTSLGFVCYVCGCVVASVLSLHSHGFQDGLLRAWSPAKILHCLPAAFLFALSTALGNMSFSQGINSALYVVLGKFYTPVAAIAARWIMGKFYMWLEWFALLILTLASAAFGYLQMFQTNADGTCSKATLPAALLVLAAAAISAFASLVTEKILKGESVPFHIQKVRLDVGSITSSVVLLPLIGITATRLQDIPWADRPVDKLTCPSDVCWNIDAGSCASADCHCECTRGIFAGWNSWVLFFAVIVNTLQGWLVGNMTKRFSVIHRALADSLSLLVIYFVGDPLFNHTSLDNVGLSLVALIVPVSIATFSVATSEMQKVFKATEKLKRHTDNASLDWIETVSVMASDTASER